MEISILEKLSVVSNLASNLCHQHPLKACMERPINDLQRFFSLSYAYIRPLAIYHFIAFFLPLYVHLASISHTGTRSQAKHIHVTSLERPISTWISGFQLPSKLSFLMVLKISYDLQFIWLFLIFMVGATLFQYIYTSGRNT